MTSCLDLEATSCLRCLFDEAWPDAAFAAATAVFRRVSEVVSGERLKRRYSLYFTGSRAPRAGFSVNFIETIFDIPRSGMVTP